MQIRSSGGSYFASSLTELGQFVDLCIHVFWLFEIYFALRVVWFTVLSCKKLRRNQEFENGLRKIHCYVHCTSELAELN